MIEQTSWFQLQPLYQYVRKQSENRQFMKYLEIGATFSLISVFLFFAIMPTASAISSLIGDIKSKQTISDSMSTKITNLMKAQDTFSQIQGDYSVIESSYPSLPNFYKSAATFSYISKDASLPIRQVNFQVDNQKAKNNDTFGLNLNMAGNYQSIIKALNQMSNARRLLDIKSIQISQSSKELSSFNNQLNLNISADLYYLSNSNDQK